MSHWAEIDKNNKVIRENVGDNNDPAGDEGYQWLMDNLGGTWIKTSYNGTIRGNFAGIGDDYLKDLDIFIAPQCHDEAKLNVKSAKWDCENKEHKIETLA
jgi:hypothetical protein